MKLEHIPLARQLDMVFRQLNDELAGLQSGIIFIHIRNNIVGKFGIRHDPIQSKEGALSRGARGLNEAQREAFRQMAIDSLKFKRGWTHGEIEFEFALQNYTLVASVQFESNYNMANLLSHEGREVSRL